MKFAMIFPGQGSQSLGMMAAYGDHPIIRATFDEASEAIGRDLWQLASDGPADLLNQTVNTQPLMLTADIAVFRLWVTLGGAMPTVVAGHSLGEYAALVAAGVLELGQAVPLVELRAKAMQEAVPAGHGAMAAVLGLDSSAVIASCRDASEIGVAEAVNFNDPKQTVIAGEKRAVERAAALAKERGAKRTVMLPVSAPFHCSLMRPAAGRLAQALSRITLSSPRVAVINNVDVAMKSDAAAIADALIRQAAAPVRWVETMQALANMGISQVFECGPGRVLTGLAKRCADGLTATALVDLASIESTISLNVVADENTSKT